MAWRIFVTVFSLSVFALAEDWPRFRGANGAGLSDNTGLPVEFGPQQNVVWKTAIPFGRSSPVIAGDHIFVTASENGKLITLCLDRGSGKIQWRREIAPSRHSEVYRQNDAASPSPATDGKNVYAFFADFGLVSYGPDGNERWRVPLGPFDTFFGLAASPVAAEGTVVMLCDTRKGAFVIAVDAETGKQRWRAERGGPLYDRFESYSTPVIYKPQGQPTQVILGGAKRLEAYNLRTGEQVWKLGGLATFPVASPVIHGDLLLATTFGADAPMGPTFDQLLEKFDKNKDGKLSREELKDAGELYDMFGAFDANNDGFFDREESKVMIEGTQGDYGLLAVKLGRTGDLSGKGYVWREKKTFSTIVSPLVYDGLVYTVKDGGIVGVLDARTGEVVKVGRSKEAMENYYSSPVGADGKVYFITDQGKVTVVKAGRDWEVLKVNDLGEECYASPAIAGSRIFIRTRGALYAFGAK
jgi:outer membrane protein assembly factor BamB